MHEKIIIIKNQITRNFKESYNILCKILNIGPNVFVILK
jgi:hypothetical protein